MVSLDIVIMLLLNLATDVSKFEFALFELTGGSLSYDLVDPSDLKNILNEIKKNPLNIWSPFASRTGSS